MRNSANWYQLVKLAKELNKSLGRPVEHWTHSDGCSRSNAGHLFVQETSIGWDLREVIWNEGTSKCLSQPMTSLQLYGWMKALQLGVVLGRKAELSGFVLPDLIP